LADADAATRALRQRVARAQAAAAAVAAAMQRAEQQVARLEAGGVSVGAVEARRGTARDLSLREETLATRAAADAFDAPVRVVLFRRPLGWLAAWAVLPACVILV
jgi:hypothetical protein